MNTETTTARPGSELAAGGEVLQLAQPLEIGSPRGDLNPPFMYSLTAKHGEGMAMAGQNPEITCASDTFAMGVHTGTHIDSLAHCAFAGRLFDGTDVFAPANQDDAHGVRAAGGEAMRPIVAPGVLLDFPALLGVECVAPDYAITPEEIERAERTQGVRIERGDVALLRTGWDTLWNDPTRFLSLPLPGATGDAARLLAARGVVATGSDTVPYEQVPSSMPLEVHAELLAKAGIFIMECLNMCELAARRTYRFDFVALPLRIMGATGSPINPIAIIHSDAC